STRFIRFGSDLPDLVLSQVEGFFGLSNFLLNICQTALRVSYSVIERGDFLLRGRHASFSVLNCLLSTRQLFLQVLEFRHLFGDVLVESFQRRIEVATFRVKVLFFFGEARKRLVEPVSFVFGVFQFSFEPIDTILAESWSN